MDFAQSLFFDFVTLLAIINPVQAAASFATLTYQNTPGQQRQIAGRACLTALILLVIFAFIGELVLKALGISFDAFRVAGGLLILLVGIGMVFSKDTASHGAPEAEDPSTFPLAIPIIAGPGALTTILALVAKRGETPLEIGLVIFLAALVMAIVYISMRVSQPLLRLFGSTGVNAVGRVMGILVTSIAVQIIVNGLRGLFPVLGR